MDVVIDTGIIYKDPRLIRAHFRIICTQAEAGNLQLVVPEVVMRQAVGKSRQRSADTYRDMTKAAEELRRLGLPNPIPTPDAQNRAVEAYERELRGRCAAQGAEITALPTPSHDQFVNMAVAKTKPFNAAGAGYRDALIWETVAEGAANEPVAFITTNTKDFMDDPDAGRPGRDLVADSSHRVPGPLEERSYFQGLS